jgi:hypothetical protein
MGKKNRRRSRERKPVPGAKVKLKKRPVPGPAAPPDSTACLVFGLQLLDHGGPYAWSNALAAHIKAIAAKCKGWESMTPAAVFSASGNKPIPWESFSGPAQKRLVEIELDDYDGLWELRVSGKQRLWGILDRNIFYIVWWDPEHEVCPALKKRT